MDYVILWTCEITETFIEISIGEMLLGIYNPERNELIDTLNKVLFLTRMFIIDCRKNDTSITMSKTIDFFFSVMEAEAKFEYGQHTREIHVPKQWSYITKDIFIDKDTKTKLNNIWHSIANKAECDIKSQNTQIWSKPQDE